MTANTEVERIRAAYATRTDPSDYYSLSRPANQFFQFQTIRDCTRVLQQAGAFPLAEKRIADIGCRGANWLLEFVQWGAQPELLAGIDLDEAEIEKARRRLPAADLRAGNAAELPWPDHSFDLVTQFVVFTSILDDGMKRAIAREMIRITKPGGVILWYDFAVDNPRNRSVRGVKPREIESLFPRCQIDLRSATLAPPLVRVLAPRAWSLALLAEGLPFLRTHQIGTIRPEASARI
jgi:SAM-dependent methyltransferase